MSKAPSPVKPVEHSDYQRQYCESDGEKWSVLLLIEESKDLPAFDLPLMHMDLSDIVFDQCTPRQMAGHIKAVQNADLSKPIILCEDGSIMDGRHRVIKALVEGKPTVKAVRFDVTPEPCRVEDNGS